MTPQAGRPVALITGAARGIGAATVRRLDRQGWSLAAVDRADDDPRLPYSLGSAAELDLLVADCRDGLAIVADAADPAAIDSAVRRSEEHFGAIDAVIAVAGVIGGGSPQWEVPLEREQAVIDGCLTSALMTARAGIPALLRRPQPRAGRFIAVASAAATRGLPMLAAYCAAKAGVSALVRALAVELRGSGVTANAVSPGSTQTAILDESARLYNLQSAQTFAAQQPVERLLQPDEVAAMIAWLAGADGSGLTGATVAVDGGLAL